MVKRLFAQFPQKKSSLPDLTSAVAKDGLIYVKNITKNIRRKPKKKKKLNNGDTKEYKG